MFAVCRGVSACLTARQPQHYALIITSQKKYIFEWQSKPNSLLDNMATIRARGNHL